MNLERSEHVSILNHLFSLLCLGINMMVKLSDDIVQRLCLRINDSDLFAWISLDCFVVDLVDDYTFIYTDNLVKRTETHLIFNYINTLNTRFYLLYTSPELSSS